MVGKMRHVFQTFIIIFTLRTIPAAPVVQNNERQPKHLSFLDYLPGNVDFNDVDFVSMDLAGDDLSRTVPSRKNPRPGVFNSPVYYIRLPPQPYMFVPGLGYVSQPSPPSPISQFVNLPVSFVSNGKPAGIYQWSGTFQDFQTEAPPPASYPDFHKIPKPTKKPLRPDSTVHRVPGTFTFNGKPDDIYVLRDSYNSLYSDVLQNVYP